MHFNYKWFGFRPDVLVCVFVWASAITHTHTLTQQQSIASRIRNIVKQRNVHKHVLCAVYSPSTWSNDIFINKNAVPTSRLICHVDTNSRSFNFIHLPSENTSEHWKMMIEVCVCVCEALVHAIELCLSIFIGLALTKCVCCDLPSTLMMIIMAMAPAVGCWLIDFYARDTKSQSQWICMRRPSLTSPTTQRL